MVNENLREKVEELRSDRYRIMKKKDNLTDNELLEMSREIDILLNKYLKQKYAADRLKK